MADDGSKRLIPYEAFDAAWRAAQKQIDLTYGLTEEDVSLVQVVRIHGGGSFAVLRNKLVDLESRLDLVKYEADRVLASAEINARCEATCGECCRMFASGELRFLDVYVPGVHYLRFCQACISVVLKRHEHKLARRSIRPALARARAVRLPATLSESEWQRTVQYFGGLCSYCQKRDWYIVEHATPIVLGGGTTAANCVPACYTCNKEKGARSIETMAAVWPGAARALEWLRQQGRK